MSDIKTQAKWESLGRETIGSATHSHTVNGDRIIFWHKDKTKAKNTHMNTFAGALLEFWRKDEDRLRKAYEEAYAAWLCCTEEEKNKAYIKLSKCRKEWLNH